jgi:DNA-binding FadR family transcriptional regulator
MSDIADIFIPVQGYRAFEEVSSKIKGLILDGILKPGDKLPSETVLANKFNVGRQTIREALRVLELSGLVVIKKGFQGGPVVKAQITEKITDLFIDACQFEKITVEEFTKARLAIEKATLNEAIDNADDKDIKSLKKNLFQAKEKIAKGEIATDINFQFHTIIAKASKNKALIIFESLSNAIHRDLRSRSPVDFKTTKDVVNAHEKILDVIERRDREKAIKLLDEHIKSVKKTYE